MRIRLTLFASMLALNATLFSGCQGVPDPVSMSGSLPVAASIAATGWTSSLGQPTWAIHAPAITSYAMLTGWTLDPNQPDGLGNYRVRRYTSGTSQLVSGSLRDIDIISNTQLWGLDAANRVYKNLSPYSTGGGTWTLVCATSNCIAHELAAGANGTVVTSYYDYATGLSRLLRYNAANNTWIVISNGKDIWNFDVDNNGDLWAVEGGGYRILKLPGSNPAAAWQEWFFPTKSFHDIAVGNGMVYVTDRSEMQADNGRVRRFIPPSTFIETNGFMHDLHVDVSGRVWATNTTSTNLYKFVP